MEANKTIVFHNNRCSKSRCAIDYLNEEKIDYEVFNYLDGISKEKLQEVVSMIGIKPEELVRKSEKIYKENYKGKTLTDNEWLNAMVEHPVLIERPIVIKDGKAVIGRPLERVIELMK